MAGMFPVGTPPGTTINTLGNSTWSSANPYGQLGTDPLGGDSGLPWWMDPQNAERINQAMLAAAQNNEFNQGITQGGLKVQQGQLGVNKNAQQATQQYQQGLLQQALMTLQQNAQQFGQTFGLQQAGVTGTYNGAPTLAALTAQQQNALAQAGLMGYDAQGRPTLAGTAQQQQNVLAQAGLMGYDAQGRPTLAGTAQQQANAIAQGNLGVSQGALTGVYNGQETLAAQAQRAAQEQARAQLGLGTLQFGSTLSGPGKWLEYENAAGAARANPALAQGVASWADMTNGRPTGGGGWAAGYQPQVRSLGTMANDFGYGGGIGSTADLVAQAAQGGGGRSNDQVYAGGSSAFNEQGGGGMQAPNTNATANALAQTGMHTNQWAPGWWNGLNPDQQQMTMDAWSQSGQSPQTVLANASRNRMTQGFGARAA
jgi:hypothetical protein